MWNLSSTNAATLYLPNGIVTLVRPAVQNEKLVDFSTFVTELSLMSNMKPSLKVVLPSEPPSTRISFGEMGAKSASTLILHGIVL